jgi:hypothetical protein
LIKCYTKSAIREWGIYYSNLWSVVRSNKWANLKEESGNGGFSPEVIALGTSMAAEKNRGRTKDNYPNRAIAAEKASKKLTGRTNQNHSGVAKRSEKLRDQTIYHFIHLDGREEKLTQYEMRIKHSLTQNRLNIMIRGFSNSHKGWRLVSGSSLIGNDLISEKKKSPIIYHFIHLDGREEKLTQYEMVDKHNLCRANLNAIIRGRRRITCGWSFLGIVDQSGFMK